MVVSNMNSKKGQAVSLGSAPSLILLLVLSILIAAAAALALDSFKETQCTNVGYSFVSGECTNGTVGVTRGDYAVNATTGGLSSLTNLSEQVPTVGTIIGVALIVAVVISAFVFFIGGKSGAL